MRIIGIDPGYERLGIAIIEKGAKDTLVHSECFRTDASLPFSKRLLALGEHLAQLIKAYEPDHLALENVYFNSNQKTAMDVAAVRGLLLYLAESNSMNVCEYTPPQIKVAVTGNGRAQKKDVETMIGHLVALEKKKRLDDEYDAIAVALTHSACVR